MAFHENCVSWILGHDEWYNLFAVGLHIRNFNIFSFFGPVLVTWEFLLRINLKCALSSVSEVKLPTVQGRKCKTLHQLQSI